MNSCCIVLFASLVSLPGPQDPAPSRDFNADLLDIAELYRLTDELGDDIFPGFDTRTIPIAINFMDRQELLIHHPRPSPDYRPLEGVDAAFGNVLLRNGVSRYGPRGGGWAVELLGEQTAYVCIPESNQSLEDWLSLVVHECFHVFQRKLLKKELQGSGYEELPEMDPRYLALIGLESRVLAAAFTPVIAADDAMRELAEMFVAVRANRRQTLSPGVVFHENMEEYNEGTATYSQARLLEWMVDNGGIEPVGAAHYTGFEGAPRMLRELLARIVPPPGLLTFMHAQYQHGMAQCLLLDRFRPDWKEVLAEDGTPLTSLLEQAMTLSEELRKQRFEQACERFDLESLLADQTALVDQRIALVKGFLEGPGRRYRIYQADLPGSFNWKPLGPVYNVPEGLLPEDFTVSSDGRSRSVGAQATVWAGGFEAFDKDHLHFQSKTIPIVFGPYFFEWTDPTPAEDHSDLKIEFDSQEGDEYRNARIHCEEFALTAKAVRIVYHDNVVEIHPLR